jgi:hypothetical protein
VAVRPVRRAVVAADQAAVSVLTRTELDRLAGDLLAELARRTGGGLEAGIAGFAVQRPHVASTWAHVFDGHHVNGHVHLDLTALTAGTALRARATLTALAALGTHAALTPLGALTALAGDTALTTLAGHAALTARSGHVHDGGQPPCATLSTSAACAATFAVVTGERQTGYGHHSQNAHSLSPCSHGRHSGRATPLESIDPVRSLPKPPSKAPAGP